MTPYFWWREYLDQVTCISAFVVMSESSALSSESTRPTSQDARRELVEWCRARLLPVAVPARISILTEMPLTPSGKLDRLALAANDDAQVITLEPHTGRVMHVEQVRGLCLYGTCCSQESVYQHQTLWLLAFLMGLCVVWTPPVASRCALRYRRPLDVAHCTFFCGMGLE